MTITVDLPEKTLIAAIRRLPAAKRRRVIAAIESDTPPQPIQLVTVSASSFRKLEGIISIGGDALLDSERM